VYTDAEEAKNDADKKNERVGHSMFYVIELYTEE
jgi:hypothetical protein